MVENKSIIIITIWILMFLSVFNWEKILNNVKTDTKEDNLTYEQLLQRSDTSKEIKRIVFLKKLSNEINNIGITDQGIKVQLEISSLDECNDIVFITEYLIKTHKIPKKQHVHTYCKEYNFRYVQVVIII